MWQVDRRRAAFFPAAICLVVFLAVFFAPAAAQTPEPLGQVIKPIEPIKPSELPGQPPQPAPSGRTPGAILPGLTGQTIRIGTWGPQSGPASSWGAIVRGMETYIKWINARGGIHNRKLELVGFDDGYDPEKTLAGVRSMVENPESGVFAFTGGVGTRPGLAVLDYLVDKKVPWIAPASGCSKFGQPPRKTVFALIPPDRDQAATLVKYAVEVLGKRKIAFFYQDDAYGRDGLEGARSYLREYRLELAAEISIQPDFRALKTRAMMLKEAGPDAVIMWVNPAHAVLMRQNAREYGLSPVWMTGGALADPILLDKLTGGLWEGTIYTSFGELPVSENPLLRDYRRAFNDHARRGERWSVYYYMGFGLAEPLVEALQRCGPEVTRQKFIEKMESLENFKGILGRVTYGPDRRQGQEEMFIAQATKRGGARALTGWFRYRDLPPVPERYKEKLPPPPEEAEPGEGEPSPEPDKKPGG